MFLRRRWPSIVLGLMMALYLAYFGWFTLRAYDAFLYQAYDLGIYDQAVWNTAHGHLFRSTIEEPYDILLGDHFEPILLPISLLYLLWDSPKLLLVIQTAGLALGAIPVYWLARDGLKRVLGGTDPDAPAPTGAGATTAGTTVQGLALLFAGLYLLYPPVHSANVFEFHPSALAIPFLLFAIAFLRRGQIVPYFIFVILAMSTKETMPLTTAALGLYALWIEKKRAVGLWTLVISTAWFGLAVFVLIPYFSPENQSQYFGERYGWLGTSMSEILGRLIAEPGLLWRRLIRPDNLAYMSALLRPAGYISLLGLPMLLGALPGLFLNLLSDWPPQHDPLNFYQYAAPIAPFVIAAAIDGTTFLAGGLGSLLERLGPVKTTARGSRLALVSLLGAGMFVTALVVQRTHGYLPFSQDYSLPVQTRQAEAARTLVAKVPPASSVSADMVFGPYLGHRENLFVFPALHGADYLAIDASYRDTLFNPRDRFDAIQNLLASGEYGVVDGQDGYLLLGRDAAQQAIPSSFYDFARMADPPPQFRTNIVFGDELRLVGFDMAWARSIRPRVNLVLYWQALQPVNRDLLLFFILTGPSGELIPGTELEFDASVWYPAQRWSPAEMIRTETARWFLEEPRRFGVAVGVVEGPGFWEVDKRLHPAVGSTPWPVPQVHDGSLVWLATLAIDGQTVTLEPPGTE